MNDRQYLQEYVRMCQHLLMSDDVAHQLVRLKQILVRTRASGKKMIIAGNGGSAAIASHCAVDFNKTADIRCMSCNEPSLITCLANDYGYERWLEKALEWYADEGDLLILISSSGQSMNMVHAADYARTHGLTLVTFSGFAADNPLRSRGHLNFWVDSQSYNIVEMLHQFWLLSVCDLIAASRIPRLRRKGRTVPKSRRLAAPLPSAA